MEAAARKMTRASVDCSEGLPWTPDRAGDHVDSAAYKTVPTAALQTGISLVARTRLW